MAGRHERLNDHADLMHVEFDARAPKLRLQVFAFLVENEQEATPEKVDEMVQYIGADIEAYTEMIRTMAPEEPTIIVKVDEDNPYGEDGRYL